MARLTDVKLPDHVGAVLPTKTSVILFTKSPWMTLDWARDLVGSSGQLADFKVHQ